MWLSAAVLQPLQFVPKREGGAGGDHLSWSAACHHTTSHGTVNNSRVSKLFKALNIMVKVVARLRKAAAKARAVAAAGVISCSCLGIVPVQSAASTAITDATNKREAAGAVGITALDVAGQQDQHWVHALLLQGWRAGSAAS